MQKLTAALRRRWPILLVLTLVGALLGAVSGILADNDSPGVQRYEATQVVIARKDANTVLVPQDALKIVRGEVLERAAERLGNTDDASRESRGVTTTYEKDASSITITCRRLTAAEASDCTQAFVDAFIEVANEDSQQTELIQLEQIEEAVDEAIAERDTFTRENPELFGPQDSVDPMVRARFDELQSIISSHENDIANRQFQLARAAPYQSLGAEPAKREKTGSAIAVPASIPLRTGILGLLGLTVAAIAVLFIERAFPRIDSREDLIDVTDLPILTEIGHLDERKQPFENGSIQLEGPWAEQYRQLRAAVRFMQTTGDPEAAADAAGPDADYTGRPLTILVTSTLPSEGKTTTAALLGLACAEHDRTIVLDADFRRPRLHRLLGSPEGPTLEDRAKMSVDRPSLADIVLRTQHERLYLVPSGQGTREVTGRIRETRAFLRAASGTATIIVDTSPRSVTSDALDLLDRVDYTILVVKSGSISVKQLQQTIEVLSRMGTPIMGIVLVASRSLGRDQRLYYEYYADA